MVTAFLFYVHIIFALFVFTKRWQEEGLGPAILILIFIGIIFSVGWTISFFIVQLFFSPIGFGKYYNRDTISLTLLTLLEYIFYSFYFRGKVIFWKKSKDSNPTDTVS